MATTTRMSTEALRDFDLQRLLRDPGMWQNAPTLAQAQEMIANSQKARAAVLAGGGGLAMSGSAPVRQKPARRHRLIVEIELDAHDVRDAEHEVLGMRFQTRNVWSGAIVQRVLMCEPVVDDGEEKKPATKP